MNYYVKKYVFPTISEVYKLTKIQDAVSWTVPYEGHFVLSSGRRTTKHSDL